MSNEIQLRRRIRPEINIRAIEKIELRLKKIKKRLLDKETLIEEQKTELFDLKNTLVEIEKQRKEWKKTTENNNLLQTSLHGCREKLKKSCEQKQQLENERSEIIKSWRVESDSQQRQIENLTEKLLEQLKNKGLWNKTINLFKRKIFIKK